MRLCAWGLTRLRSDSPSLDPLRRLVHNVAAAHPSQGFCFSSPRFFSAADGGDGESGHQGVHAGDDVGDTSGEVGDRRLWRKWIEDRLALGKTETEEGSGSTSSRGSPDAGVTESQSAPPNADSGVKSTVRETKDLWRPIENINAFRPKPSASSSGTSNVTNPLSFLNRSKVEKARDTSRQAEQKASAVSSTSRMDMLLNKVEAFDDFEHRVLGTANDDDDLRDDEFLQELDELGRSARGVKDFDDEDEESGLDEDEQWDDDKAQVLTDLALSNMEIYDLEDEERPYRLREDRLFFPGQTYDPEDLDMSIPVAKLDKPTTRTRKVYPSKQVLQFADFRNPRYLSNFIKESSKILPRRHHQVSAKAQRQIAREIKTARIFGLMPFTSMGEPPFRFLRSRSEDE